MEDPKLQAIEEMTYGTANALESVIEILIEKGYISKQEILDKLDALDEGEDIEELGYDADAPRDPD